MKTKLLAMMLLVGGTMFAQSRFSVGIGVGGYGGGYSQPVPYVPPCPGFYDANGFCVESYAQPFYGGLRAAPRFDNHFSDRDDRRGFSRGFEQDRNRGVSQGRNSGGENRGPNQSRGNRR
jgi:hypothetical protein